MLSKSLKTRIVELTSSSQDEDSITKTIKIIIFSLMFDFNPTKIVFYLIDELLK
jgi:hypothetical protein